MQLARRPLPRPSAGPPAGSAPYELDQPRVWIVKRWGEGDDRDRLKMLREIVTASGRDPRIASVAVQIIREARVAPRDYRGQAAALLAWVQHRIYYVNEPDERLQDPLYTLRVGYGDCDDEALLLAALLWSIRLSYRFVIAGHRKLDRAPVRYVEGEKGFPDAVWAHIYLAVGPQPFASTYAPGMWAFMEPTLQGAPLGWDVFASRPGGGGPQLPELAGLGAFAGTGSTGSGLASALTLGGELTWQKLIAAAVVGTVTMVAGTAAVETYRDWRRKSRRRR